MHRHFWTSRLGELYLTSKRLVWFNRWYGRWPWHVEIKKESVAGVTTYETGVKMVYPQWGVKVSTKTGEKSFEFFGDAIEGKSAAEQWASAIKKWANL